MTTWHLITAKVATNFSQKPRTFGRYSILDGKLRGLQYHFVYCEQEKNFFLLPGIDPDSLDLPVYSPSLGRRINLYGS
jgi:hypothetical protein